MDLKTETDDLNGNISKIYAVLKKTALKTNFRCESDLIFKREAGITFTKRLPYNRKVACKITLK